MGVARVSERINDISTVEEYIPVVSKIYDSIKELPQPEPGIIYIVSVIVLFAAHKIGRTDCISPDTSPESAIRDEKGVIIGVKRFQK